MKQNIPDALTIALGQGPAVNKGEMTVKPADVLTAPYPNLENLLKDIPDVNLDLGFTLTHSKEVTVHEITEQIHIIAQNVNDKDLYIALFFSFERGVFSRA